MNPTKENCNRFVYFRVDLCTKKCWNNSVSFENDSPCRFPRYKCMFSWRYKECL